MQSRPVGAPSVFLCNDDGDGYPPQVRAIIQEHPEIRRGLDIADPHVPNVWADCDGETIYVTVGAHAKDAVKAYLQRYIDTVASLPVRLQFVTGG